MKMYKIRVTGDVLETAAATRRVNVNGQVLTFGREPVYIRADELPPELADDLHLRIEAVATVADTDIEPPGGEVIDLKSERVQEPTAAADEEIDLKSERVQEPTAAADEEIDLKSERVQEPGSTVAREANRRRR
jgi:hypothetical protein